MKFIDTIFSLVWDISDWFYQAYSKVKGWVWPFNELGPPLYWCYKAFWGLLTPISLWYEWTANVIARLELAVTSTELGKLLLEWFNIFKPFIEWVDNAYDIVHSWISDWWRSTSLTVKTWIAQATQGFNDLVAAWNTFWNTTWPAWTKSFNTLKAAWDNFWGNIFPTLVSFSWLTSWWSSRLKEISALINDTIKAWFPFYDDMVRLWGSIVDFFTNPVEFVWARFTEWFLGPEV